jgi:hypothetical protein
MANLRTAIQNRILADSIFPDVAEHEAAFNHDNIPSDGEKIAMEGTSGTPGINNKYITNVDPRMDIFEEDGTVSDSALDLDYSPSNYIRDPTAAGAEDAADLPAHLKGIDTEIVKRIKTFALDTRLGLPNGIDSIYLKHGSVCTMINPIIMSANATLRRSSLVIDKTDSNTFSIQILVNETMVESFSLTSNTLKVVSGVFSATLNAGDEVQVRLLRTSGNGSSAFKLASVILEIEER